LGRRWQGTLLSRIARKGNDVVAAGDERVAQSATNQSGGSSDGDMSWHECSVYICLFEKPNSGYDD
jgi:hypothetical protein